MTESGLGVPRSPWQSLIQCQLVVGIILAAATTLHAQAPNERYELFAQGGASFFTSSNQTLLTLTVIQPPSPDPVVVTVQDRNSFGTTGRLFVGARFYLTRKEALEVGYSFSPNRLQDRITFTSSPPVIPSQTFFSSQSMWVHNWNFNYVRYLPGPERAEPFVTGGLGFVRFAIVGETETKFAGNFGGGVDFPLQRSLRLRVELRDFVSERPFVGSTTHNIVPSLGLAFRF